MNHHLKTDFMKKLFLILGVLAMCGAVKAQESGWGIRVGMNVSKFAERVDNELCRLQE